MSTASAQARTTRPAGRPEAPVRTRRHSVGSFWPQYLAISPFYILFAVFGAFPILFSIWLSLHTWNGMGPMKWVGLHQYQFLLTDQIFWKAVANTFIIWFLSTVPMILLALLLAFLLTQRIRGKSIYRTALFIPNVTSMVAMALVFISVFSDTFGVINGVLSKMGTTIPWMTSKWGIKCTIALMVIWRWTGYNALVFLAGMQSINTELYESARVDGASTWDMFTRITIPLLRPVILFVVITSTIGGLSLFTEPQILFGTSGGPNQSGLTIVLYQYQQAFEQFDFGYGSAIGWGLFFIAAIFAFINWKLVGGSDAEAKAERGNA